MSVGSEGYWVSPKGDIITVPHRHINTVVDHPEKFNLTKEEVKKVFEKHKEPLGFEGFAREEIMTNLIKDDWIRIRYIPRSDSFTVQVDKMTVTKKNQLYSFAHEALKGIGGAKYSPNTELKILDLGMRDLDKLSLSEAIEYEFKSASVIGIQDYVVESKLARIKRKVLEKLR